MASVKESHKHVDSFIYFINETGRNFHVEAEDTYWCRLYYLLSEHFNHNFSTRVSKVFESKDSKQ